MALRILTVDIETAPNLAHVWTLFNANIALNQLIMPSYILCWAAKWVGETEVHFGRVEHQVFGDQFSQPKPESQRAMLEPLLELLEEADAVVSFNGDRFDLPYIRGELLEHGLGTMPVFRSIDLYTTAKRVRFPSHKLEHMANRLGLGGKVKHEGHALWRKCMLDDEGAWTRMKRYNEGDVRLTERLYRKLRGSIPNHPNLQLYGGKLDACPTCNGKLRSEGLRRTTAQVYRRYVCLNCGARPRGVTTHAGPVQRRL